MTERNLQKAAERVYLKSPLVSVEVDYLRDKLGHTASQQDIDENVRQVRQTPWNELMAR
ncbi:MAG TPA: hypothetical protein VMS56_08190 [Thermoanaerobaculia bacterium]|nr:hypothetical protein [Thermoanaerobaculia bacterium]